MCSIYPVDFQQTNEQEDRERMRWWRYDNREGDVVCLTKREHKRAISSLSHGPSCRYIQLLASIHFSQIQSSFVGKLQTNAECTGTGTRMFASNLEQKESLTVVLVVHFVQFCLTKPRSVSSSSTDQLLASSVEISSDAHTLFDKINVSQLRYDCIKSGF